MSADDAILRSMVSVDDHVIEPPTLWTDRLPSRDHELGPRIERRRIGDAVRDGVVGVYEPLHVDERSEAWVDVWRYEDVRFAMMKSFGAAGTPSGNIEALPGTYDDYRPGCFEREARLADMDVNGVDVSLCYPNMFVRFCGQRFLEAQDKDLALRCVRAYNDWLAEEWSGPSGGRLHGVYILPMWDAGLAAAEVERIAGHARVVSFSEIPPWLGLPSIYSRAWDPLFEACQCHDIVVAMHIGSSSRQARSSDDSPPVLWLANHYTVSSLALSDWLLSGVLDRFPRLRVAFAESQAGWIPYLLDRLDRAWHRNDPYLFSASAPRTLAPPSSYLPGRFFTCIFDDPSAMFMLERIGEDLVCFETDYPHSDGTWPESSAVAEKHTKDLTPEQRAKVLRHNGLRLLSSA